MDNFSFENKPRNGPFKKTSNRDNRAFIWHAFANPKDTLFVFATPSKLCYKFGCNTLQKTLKAYGKLNASLVGSHTLSLNINKSS